MTAPTPFDVWRAAVVAAVRGEIDNADAQRWEALATAYRGIRRTEEGRQMIDDWIGREVVATPRDGMQTVGTLTGTDKRGITLGDSGPALHPSIKWGTVHFPWANVAHTRLTQPQQTGARR
ncbi:MAG: hypothetical protein PIR02_11850 [Microbacterium enclense]